MTGMMELVPTGRSARGKKLLEQVVPSWLVPPLLIWLIQPYHQVLAFRKGKSNFLRKISTYKYIFVSSLQNNYLQIDFGDEIGNRRRLGG